MGSRRGECLSQHRAAEARRRRRLLHDAAHLVVADELGVQLALQGLVLVAEAPDKLLLRARRHARVADVEGVLMRRRGTAALRRVAVIVEDVGANDGLPRVRLLRRRGAQEELGLLRHGAQHSGLTRDGRLGRHGDRAVAAGRGALEALRGGREVLRRLVVLGLGDVVVLEALRLRRDEVVDVVVQRHGRRGAGAARRGLVRGQARRSAAAAEVGRRRSHAHALGARFVGADARRVDRLVTRVAVRHAGALRAGLVHADTRRRVAVGARARGRNTSALRARFVHADRRRRAVVGRGDANALRAGLVDADARAVGGAGGLPRRGQADALRARLVHADCGRVDAGSAVAGGGRAAVAFAALRVELDASGEHALSEALVHVGGLLQLGVVLVGLRAGRL
mmetsp:Transcript_46819/g.144406  ORF Transcript_46819/g.144406 Transcript_46819/m.144406 type:complete len:396 (-) Transcript_46819:69-1256(-)